MLVKFAKALVRTHFSVIEFDDVGWGSDEYVCYHCDERATAVKRIKHKADCVVLEAKKVIKES